MLVPETEIVVTQDGAEVARKTVRPGDYVIGRDGSCDVPVASDTVSERHAQLTINYDHALIEDLGSDSGTFVNGQRVTTATRLWPSQKIQVGAATITLRRKRAPIDPDESVAPQTEVVRRLLPEEMLRVQKYDIGGQIAQGGMGAILSAKEIAIRREVAMKVMLGSGGDEDLRRFVEEAQITGQLEHPNIVPVHELSVDENDQVFYTMKLVRGVTLRQVLEDLSKVAAETVRKYPLSALLTVFQKVCDAVAFAHSKGVIHRDLKPDNIMLGDYGEVLVMDWGLGKRMKDEGGAEALRDVHGAMGTTMKRSEPSAVGDETSNARSAQIASSFIPHPSSFSDLPPSSFSAATVPGSIMGTPQYMAPEQARGEIDALDARSDIYALGAILYHILTLHPPVEAATLDEILAKVSAGQFIPPLQRALQVRPRLAAPLPKPARPLPQAIAPDAPTLLHHEAEGVGRVSPPAGRPSAREDTRPTPHLPGGAVPESLNAVVLKAMALDQAARYQSIAELQADLTAYQTGFATRAENASFAKQLVLLIKRHKGVFTTAAAAWFIITALAVWFVINVTRAKQQAENERNIAAHERDRATANEQRAVTGEQAAKVAEAKAVEEKEATRRALAKSQLALADAAYRDHDSATMQAALTGVPDDLRDANWSYLLEHADNSIATLRTQSSRNINDVAAHPKKPGVFAIVAGDGTVALVEAPTGVRLLEFRSDLKHEKGGTCHLTISPDGEKLAVGRSDEDGIAIHSTRDGKKLAEWSSDPSSRLEFSPDGNGLLQVSKSANAINLLDAATGHTVWSSKSDGPNPNTSGVFAPDGQTVLTNFGKEGLRLLSAKDGSVVRSYPAASGNYRLAFSPDGARIFSLSGQGIVRCVENKDDGHLIYQFRADAILYMEVACTADGKRLVTLGNLPSGQQSIKVWDAQTGSLIEGLMGGRGRGNRIGIHPLSPEIVVAGQTSKVWNLPTPQEKWKFPAKVDVMGAFGGMDDLLLTDRGSSGDGVRLLDLGAPNPAKQPLWEIAAKTSYLVTVSTDGRFAAIAPRLVTPIGDASVQLLRLKGRAVEVAGSIEAKGNLRLLSLSPDGALLFIGNGYNSGTVFDRVSGKSPAHFNLNGMNGPYAVSWVGNTRLLTAVSVGATRGATGSKEHLILWDAATGKQIKAVGSPTAILSFAALPGATWFAEAGADRMVRVRDTATLEVQREFRAHDDAITALALHPSRPILASASDDLTVKLWDLESGRCLDELRGPIGTTNRLEISPGGKRLACWSGNVTRIWEPKCFSENPEEKVDADGWENLLAEFKPEVLAKTGHGWQMTSGALLSPGANWATIALPGDLARSSYQVRVKLRQLAPQNVFAVVLPVADRQVAFNLDGFPEEGHFTSLALIDTQNSNTVPGALHGKQIRDADQHDLELSVQLEGANARVEATLDDTPLYQWSGPVTSLSLNPDWPAVPPGSLALGASGADWVVYAVKVKRLKS